MKNLYLPYHNNRYYPSAELMLTSIIKNKKICLLCTGGSLDLVNIECHKYDLVCGVNRIYKTKYAKHIDIFFHGCQNVDRAELSFPKIFSENEQAKIILIPIATLLGNEHIKQISYIENLMRVNKNIIFNISLASMAQIKYGTRIYTGINSLSYILEYQPQFVDVFGMDFYTNGYTQDTNHKHLKQYKRINHDTKINFKAFSDILKQNGNVNWIIDKRSRSILNKQIK